MEKISYFKENDYRWAIGTYYSILDIDGEKWIKLTHDFDKGDRGEAYDSWLHIQYSEECKMPLKSALRFDIHYQLSKLIEERCEEEGYEVGRYGRVFYDDDVIEPEECFNLANKIVANKDVLTGEIKGTKILRLSKITLDTPCGEYVDLL